MSQLPVSINGKVFNINCPDDEKENVIALAEYVNEKINLVAPKCKAMSESSLLSFTLLAIADEIFTKKKKISELEQALLTAEDMKKNDLSFDQDSSEAEHIHAETAENTQISDDVYAKIQMAIQDIKSITRELETVENNS